MSGTPVKAVSLQHAELLENARMQWPFGDWESLVKLDPGTLEKHPDRAKLALLAASAHHQLNDHAAARRRVNHAKQWGGDRMRNGQRASERYGAGIEVGEKGNT